MKFCTNCGAQLPEGTKFCTECGQRIEQAEAPAEVMAYSEPVNQSIPDPIVPVQAEPAYEPEPAAPQVHPEPAPRQPEIIPNGTLYLRLPSEDEVLYPKIRAILNMFPGENGVVLYFEDTKRRRGTRCQFHESMLRELINVLGKANVVLK